MEKEDTGELNFKMICGSCHKYLTVRMNFNRIYVEPCKHCLNEEYENAVRDCIVKKVDREEEKEEIDRRAFNQGYEEGYSRAQKDSEPGA